MSPIAWRWCSWLNFVRVIGWSSRIHGSVGNLSQADECGYLWLICLLTNVLAPFRVLSHGPSQHLMLWISHPWNGCPQKMINQEIHHSEASFRALVVSWGLSTTAQEYYSHYVSPSPITLLNPSSVRWQSILSGCQLPPNKEILLVELKRANMRIFLLQPGS
jgi:hypothetical protein